MMERNTSTHDNNGRNERPLRPGQRVLKMWKDRQLRNRPRMQGTEAVALKQLEQNSKSFRYPPGGFEQRIEFSLLYSMLSAPAGTYPISVINATIDDEDFTMYMPVNTTAGNNSALAPSSSQDDGYHDAIDENGEQDTADASSSSPTPTCHPNDISYKQLSAILAYSAEQSQHDAKATAAASGGNNNNNKDDYSTSTSTSSSSTPTSMTVAQKLCKTILSVVVAYAGEHELNRQHEIEELLLPVRRVAHQRMEKKELMALLPFYLGYSAAMITGNPIPLIIAGVGMVNAPNNRNEIENMDSVLSLADRKADVERTSLLDEIEE